MSHPLHKLIKPHFFPTSDGGKLLDAQGKPYLVMVCDGKVKIRLKQGDHELYLDPLALTSEQIGEHPTRKILRLRDMGIPIERGLESMLGSSQVPHGLFHVVDFEYLPGKETNGVITEVFPDGTFLVIPLETPPEWKTDNEGVSPPTHLHVNPRALNAGSSSLAKEYEKKILALPFDEQRYPPSPLARMQCDVYKEAVRGGYYNNILSSVGYEFTPAHTWGDDILSFEERLISILERGLGGGNEYFGFEGFWAAQRLAGMQVSWVGECDAIGRVQKYRTRGSSQDGYYAIVRHSLEPDKSRRYQVVAINDDGSGQVVYTAPGTILMAQPLPFDDTRWLLSAEGWRPPIDATPADPRWQSVYVVDTKKPDQYHNVDYPIHRYPNAPEQGLYGSSESLSADGRFLYNTLYGFTDEGGGLWATALSQEGFHDNPAAFARIAAWDHALSWTLLDRVTNGSSDFMNVFLTGKEVADDFAMTANILHIKEAGLDSRVVHRERLVRMMGWNPVPFAVQRISEREFRVAVETHFDYESSLFPRAKGVYIVPVDTAKVGRKA